VTERRDEILALAGEMFAERGFGSTTVREIADGAGILSGSLYHHFDSKESMIEEILSGFLDAFAANAQTVVDAGGDPAAVLRKLVTLAFRAVAEDATAVAVMQNEVGFLLQFPRFAFLRTRADEAEKLWVGVLEAGIRAGAFRADLDPRLTYRFMRDAIWVTVRWYRPGGRHTIDEIRDDYLRLLFGSITAGRRRGGPAARPRPSAPRRRRRG
jgi:AcrR family transcriptional regulator